MEKQNWKDFCERQLRLADNDPNGKPDCYIVFKTTPHRSSGAGFDIVGPPLAIYATKETLIERGADLVAGVDEKFGISLFAWWFD